MSNENGGGRSSRKQRLLLVGITAALAAFHLWSSRRIGGPSVIFDESGYLGNARWLAGGAEWQMPQSPTYAIGYPVALAPVMAVFHTADAQWRAVLAVNAALLASVFPLLFALLTKVANVRPRVALATAAVGAFIPAVVAAGVSAIAENLVLPLVIACVLGAWSMTETEGSGRRRWPYAYGPMVAALVATHPRFTLTLPVAIVALVVVVRSGLTRRRVAAINAALLVILTATGYVLFRVVVGSRWAATEQLEGGTNDWLDLIKSWTALWELILTGLGQAWYLAVGSAGLSVVGLIAVVRVVRGRSLAGDKNLVAGGGFAFGVLLATASVVFATSVVFFAQNQFRADHWVYGRHNDSFTPLWVSLGLASLLAPSPVRARLRDLLTATLSIGVLGLFVAIARDPMTLDGRFSPFAAPAIIRYVGDHPSQTFWRATLGGLIGVSAITALLALREHARSSGHHTAHRSAGLALVVGLIGWFSYAGFGTVTGTQAFEALLTDGWNTPDELGRLGVSELAIEGQTAAAIPTLLYPFHLPEVDVSIYQQTRGESPEAPFVLARLDDRARIRHGDRVVLLDEGAVTLFSEVPVGLAVWVTPGGDQDRLADQGRLLPKNFPGPLPRAARRVDLTLDGQRAGQTISVAAGGSVTVTMAGRHLGGVSPWPDAASFRLDGRVQVVADITPVTAGGPDGARSSGEIDRWVDPGERFRAEVAVFAVDPELQPLPPGTYRVHIGISQAGERWFSSGGDDATFVLRVTR